MKPHEQRNEFIRLRAEGKSYTAISKHLSISKDTCGKWERDLQAQISRHKADQLQELYDSYYMVKEARIKRLGETLNAINEALDQKDLTELSPDKLLDYKLKYTEVLRGEYVDIETIKPLKGEYTSKDILNSFTDLLRRVQMGTITPEQATKESAVLANMLKAYEQSEVKDKLDAIDFVLRGR